MLNQLGPYTSMNMVVDFLTKPKRRITAPKSAISLFSGAGISDLGYAQAGFKFVVQAELDAQRAALCKRNFPSSKVVIGDIQNTTDKIIQAYNSNTKMPLQLLSITPPCQGMSSSNPSRGKSSNLIERDKRNRLLLASIPIIHALKPRIVVAENVTQILKELIDVSGHQRTILDVFTESLADYRIFKGVVQMADYGIPQVRKRAILVAIRKDENIVSQLDSANRLPWPKQTHSESPDEKMQTWVTLEQWFNCMNYPHLDAVSKETAKDSYDPLHRVPHYEGDRYLLVSDIPPRSGRNAYQNDKCHSCLNIGIPEGTAYCTVCGSPMINRPYVIENDAYRLIKGFDSSYRRMFPNQPSATVTTSSSHIGSDYKIHPWENRVLSIRECAELQTVPRFYKWEYALEKRLTHTIREAVGEALPPWFTYLHGQTIYKMLDGLFLPSELAAV